MIIKLGDKGRGVSKLQKYLSLLGYDLIIDSHFGDKTLRSLKAFQKKYNLLVDGIAGPVTFTALKAAQKRTSKENRDKSRDKDYGSLYVNTSFVLDNDQYIRQVTSKNKIFIHYTVSGPNSRNVIRYWDSNEPRISTSYVISGRGDEDGMIYEAFNPDYWSYHLGIKSSKGRVDRSSIGIEICAWGRLNKKGDKFFNVYGGEVPVDEVFECDEKWRGKIYYHKYTDKQLDNLEKLINWLIKEYKIPVQNIEYDAEWAMFDDDVSKNRKPGIWSHTSVRKDKQDTYPDPKVFDILNRINKKTNG